MSVPSKLPRIGQINVIEMEGSGNCCLGRLTEYHPYIEGKGIMVLVGGGKFCKKCLSKHEEKMGHYLVPYCKPGGFDHCETCFEVDDLLGLTLPNDKPYVS